MNEQVAVSVFCLTYNHEKYIRDALEGFVSQKTNFDFEVLVHDDASTDGTAEIIREYEAKCPNIIKPVYQTENQYSKNLELGIIRTFLLPKVQGKYIAFCEGDDYWTDPLKLQKQFDFMEKNPDCTICTHRAWMKYWNRDQDDKIIPEEEQMKEYSAEEVIGHGGLLFATNSIFIRQEIYKRLPDSFRMQRVGDYPLIIYAAISGRCVCLPDVMSVYNHELKGSYTRTFKENKDFRIKQNENEIKLLQNINAYSNQKYDDVIQQRIRYFEYHIHKHLGEWEKIQGAEYEEFRQKDMQRKKLRERAVL